MNRPIAVALLLGGLALTAGAAPRGVITEDSRIEFTVKEMGVPISGRFNKFDALLELDPQQEPASVSIRVDIGSLTTGNAEADAIALQPDWLDQAHAPLATFTSHSIRPLGAGRFEANGSLVIKQVARPLTLQFKRVEQPDGKALIDSEFTLQRGDFGIGGGVWNQGDVVANSVTLKVRFRLAPR